MLTDPTYRWQRALVVLLLLVIFASLGCDRGPKMVQVRGTVTYKDGSVPKGGVRVVRFEPDMNTPEETRRTASGQIETDGSFELFTRRPGDGVFPGNYAVTFTIWKAPREAVSYVHEKYTASATSPYHVSIEDDTDDLKFEIEPPDAAKSGAGTGS
jgi:hypothetical protein